MATSTVERVKLALLRLDGGTQARAGLDAEVVESYAAAMRDGAAAFPPVPVYKDDQGNLWPGDGYHRIAAAELAGLNEIEAEVRPGTVRDARLHGLGANGKHGLPLSNADKRRAVALMLDDPEWAGWSDRKIAKWVGCSNTLVSQMRPKPTVNIDTPADRWTPMDGHCSTAEVSGWLAIVMASHHPGFFYIMVMKPQGHDPNLEGLMRPIRADGVSKMLRFTGFPVDSADWTTRPVTPGPDDDEGLDLEHCWSWPHLFYDSRQAWREEAQWWTCPRDSAAYIAGRDRVKRENANTAAVA